jgi:hypothetical protein
MDAMIPSEVKVMDQVVTGEYALYHGDCVEVLRAIPSDSIHYSVSSPPFESLFVYSASPRDMGNSGSSEAFREHHMWMVREMFRVIKPGRLVSFHCMNLPTSKVRDGYIGIRDFRGQLIKMYQDAGFIYHSEVVIWKDPVTAMQRTKALGLLHKQIVKDSAMSRQGIPDYLVTMRKPGENDEPVNSTSREFMESEPGATSVEVWQKYASPVWMDINPSDTLQYMSAREEQDERHICPLQLGVIERAIRLWTNPGDTVLDPFGGIGSTPWKALQMGRKAVAAELKASYFGQMVKNCASAGRQISLFDTLKPVAKPIAEEAPVEIQPSKAKVPAKRKAKG